MYSTQLVKIGKSHMTKTSMGFKVTLLVCTRKKQTLMPATIKTVTFMIYFVLSMRGVS